MAAAIVMYGFLSVLDQLAYWQSTARSLVWGRAFDITKTCSEYETTNCVFPMKLKMVVGC